MAESLPPVILWTLAGIVLLLALVSAVLLAAVRAGRLGADHELLLRTRSWWIIVTLFAVAVLLGPGATILLFGIASFLALKEYLSIVPTRRADRALLLWAYLAIPVQYLWVAQGWYGMFVVWIPVYMFLLMPALMVLHGETRDFLRAAASLHFGLMATVFALSHAAFLLVLPERPGVPAGGAGLLLFLLLVTEGNDVLQYACGRLFGRRAVVPRVSPGKTVEGLLGGMGLAAALAALLAPALTPYTAGEGLLLGFGLAAAGFLGDLAFSALKRDLGRKDTGTLLPGHGGILDRVDSLTYTAPLFFHITWYLHY